MQELAKLAISLVNLAEEEARQLRAALLTTALHLLGMACCAMMALAGAVLAAIALERVLQEHIGMPAAMAVAGGLLLSIAAIGYRLTRRADQATK